MHSHSDGNKPFLTAHWSELILVNYPVPKGLLEPRLPAGLELDLYDGQAYVSLVAFNFHNTRVKGIRWPGYVNFPEVNLRFYVRHDGQRGVMFVREFVPKRMIAMMASGIYNEPYQFTTMRSRRETNDDQIDVSYELDFGGRTHRISASGSLPAFLPGEDSVEHWFKEHEWGFGKDRSGRLQRYQAEHPPWRVIPVQNFVVDVDWGTLYGPEWSVLQDVHPASVTFAEGSKVAVHPAAKN